MTYVQERIAEIQAPKIKRKPRYAHIEKWTDRTGKKVHYYRIGKGSRIRLPDPDVVGQDEFQKAYVAATNGKAALKLARESARPALKPIGVRGHVYFVRSGNKVKIGFSRSITSGIKSIQTSNAERLELLMVIPGAEGTEKFFHERFADNRVGGEWFNLVGTLADFVRFTPTKL